MKKILGFLFLFVLLFTITACQEAPKVKDYYLDANGVLIAEYDDGSTKQLGTLSDTIANGVDTIIVNGNGYYVINGIETEIKARLPQSYSIDKDGNLIVTYNDQTTENLGKLGSDAINTVQTITVSDDGYYVINGIKTNIVAYSFYQVTFDTGCDITVETQTVRDGYKVTRPEVEREGFTLDGWFCNGEEWRFNSDVVMGDMELVAKWTEEVVDDTPWDDDGVLKILTVGNSFSVDSMEYVYQIAKANGVAEIELGNLYIGSCTIYKHLTNAKNDNSAYTYYTNSTGTWTSTEEYKLSTAVASENWDFISFQQSSTYSGQADTYDDLNKLIDVVKPLCTNKKVSFVWHMTWAYQGGSTHSGFANYNNDQTTMYNAIVSATQSKIVTNDNISKIVPNGTAIQNARTSYLGDTLTRDGYHLSFNQGRIIASLTMLSSLIDVDLENIDLSGISSDEAFIDVAIESTKNAILTPFAVTNSAYTEDDDEINLENYDEMDYEVYKLSYWQSVYSLDMYTETTGTALKYWATNKMTKDDLPIGSIIVIESGWRYRPEGWVGDTKNKVRPDMEIIYMIEVTEEWWGDFTIRAFNIGKTNNSDISGVSEAEIREAFKIYIPKK